MWLIAFISWANVRKSPSSPLTAVPYLRTWRLLNSLVMWKAHLPVPWMTRPVHLKRPMEVHYFWMKSETSATKCRYNCCVLCKNVVSAELALQKKLRWMFVLSAPQTKIWKRPLQKGISGKIYITVSMNLRYRCLPWKSVRKTFCCLPTSFWTRPTMSWNVHW